MVDMLQRAVSKFIRIEFKLKSHDSVKTVMKLNKIFTIIPSGITEIDSFCSFTNKMQQLFQDCKA